MIILSQTMHQRTITKVMGVATSFKHRIKRTTLTERVLVCRLEKSMGFQAMVSMSQIMLEMNYKALENHGSK